MTRKNEPRYSGDEEIIQRNMERSREVIEAKKRSADEAVEETPAQADLDTEFADALPGQQDVPAGGQSNMNVQGGSSKRHKPN